MELKADVRYFSPQDWNKYFAREAHIICFKEIREPEMNRIDYALVTFDKDIPSTFCTCRELDAESVYWQYGGVFPNIEKSVSVWKNYVGVRDYSLERYKKVFTRIQNTNLPMLKLAMQAGFIIIGVMNFKAEIFLELLLERGN